MKESVTVSRSEKNPKLAYVLFPHDLLEGCERADIEYDGGFLISFFDDGAYKVGVNGTGKATSWRLTIPVSLVSHVPFGINQCEVERLDAHQIRLQVGVR